MVRGAGEASPPVQIAASGIDTLDAAGRLPLRLKLGETVRGRPARATLEATVVDVNRQTVSASASLVVHPAEFYLGAKPEGDGLLLDGRARRCGSASSPCGPTASGCPASRVTGTVVRREWHSVRRERAGYGELVGEWVSDTVARCALTTAAEPGALRLHAAGGRHLHRDASGGRRRRPRGRDQLLSLGDRARTGCRGTTRASSRWTSIPDRTRYTVGDTATVLFASPFTDAEAWITVEREGMIEQRRLRITSGTTTLKLPITEAFAPNAFVSIVVARGRSAPPGPLDDPGRPTIRVGYAELRVTPERKRLTVDVAPRARSIARATRRACALQVRDAGGAGQRSEVTLWAVDEGVLALTGYATPDPIDLLYRPRGLGHAAGEHPHDRGAAGGRRREGEARAGRRRRRDARRHPPLALPDDRVLPRLGRDRRVGQGDGRGAGCPTTSRRSA